MDTRLLMAGGVAAVGLILLVPTFNALNASYVQDVPPPPWMPTPPTPPDMTPPTNFKPPTGMTPPTNWEGEMPPQCPPPVFRPVEGSNQNFTIEPSTPDTTWRRSFTFEVPNGTLAVGGYANFTNWQAQRVTAALRTPDAKTWDNSTEGNTGFIAQPNPDAKFQINSYVENKQQPPKAGTYTVVLTAELGIGGRAHTEFMLVLACGGLLS